MVRLEGDCFLVEVVPVSEFVGDIDIYLFVQCQIHLNIQCNEVTANDFRPDLREGNEEEHPSKDLRGETVRRPV